MNEKVYNFESFSTQQKEITKELEELTPPEFYNHPEFGLLPYNAPCEDCFELLQNRTDSARYFVEKGTNGSVFYSQKAYGPINTKNNSGQYIALNPKLKVKTEGVYVSGNQLVLPTELDVNNHQSAFILPNGERFSFNRKVEMLYVDGLNNITNLGEANWSNYTVGEEGVKVINAWPNIDIEIAYSGDRIKSSYIVKSPLTYSSGYIAFRDHLKLPSAYQLSVDDGDYVVSGNNYSFELRSAFGFDQSGLKERGVGFNYHLDSLNMLSFAVPVSWMADPEAIYPLVIDPTVTASATYSAGVIGFRYNGSWCGGSVANDCGYTLTVPKPANCTLTSITFNAQSISGSGSSCGVCYMSDIGWYFTSSCGRDSPASFWNCNNANPGTCTGTNLDVSALISCITPTCTGNVPITMWTSRCYCTGNCTSQYNCQEMLNNTWSMTITGKTIQTMSNQTYNVASCSGTTTLLNPGPSNGVPGYTYAWSNGAISSTITANNAGGPYSVTVTDACGITSTTNFTINCPLSVSLSNFSAEKIDRKVLLSWQTASEIDNDYFMIQRAGSDGVFSDLMKKPSLGNSSTLQSYSIYDENPMLGTSYYRLQIYDKQGNISTSEVQSVGFDGGLNLLIIPNPNNGTYQLGYHFPEKGMYVVELYSSRGQQLIYNEINANKGYQTIKLDEIPLQSGIYFVKLHTKNQVIVEKMVVE